MGAGKRKVKFIIKELKNLETFSAFPFLACFFFFLCLFLTFITGKSADSAVRTLGCVSYTVPCRLGRIAAGLAEWLKTSVEGEAERTFRRAVRSKFGFSAGCPWQTLLTLAMPDTDRKNLFTRVVIRTARAQSNQICKCMRVLCISWIFNGARCNWRIAANWLI